MDNFGPINSDSLLEAQHTYFATVKLGRYYNFLDDDNIYYVGPFFKYQGKDIGLTNNFDVKLKDEHDVILLDSLVKMMNTRIVRKMKSSSLIYILSCSKESAGNALEMANYFYETTLFEYSEPNFAFYSFVD